MRRTTVFVCTSPRQRLSAEVAAFSLKHRSRAPDSFDTVILDQSQHPFLDRRHGQRYLRAGRAAVWDAADQQAFTPLRFLVPELMSYSGRALVIDPDIFAVGDVTELLERDMKGKTLLCRERPGKGSRPTYLASSVMLLDCAKLTHWDCRAAFEELFAFKRDYTEWLRLRLEPRDNIALFEQHWNDFDHLDENTRLLHNTNRRTQPWKTGLPMIYNQHKTSRLASALMRVRRRAEGALGLARRHGPHPDPHQESAFFELLAAAIAAGEIDMDAVKREVASGNIRANAVELVGRAQVKHDRQVVAFPAIRSDRPHATEQASADMHAPPVRPHRITSSG